MVGCADPGVPLGAQGAGTVAAEILAFHRCGRITNGRLEGTNNKLGVLKRIAYGFVNADNFAARALLWCPPVAS